MAFDIREEDEDRHYNDEFEEYEDVKQPQRPKFYRRKKFWMFCIPNAIIGIIIAVVLALYVIMPKIAQGLMNKSTIEFSAIVSVFRLCVCLAARMMLVLVLRTTRSATTMLATDFFCSLNSRLPSNRCPIPLYALTPPQNMYSQSHLPYK